MKRLSFLALLLLLLHPAWAQKKLPVLRSGSTTLSVKEGNFLYRDVWEVSTKTKPDVFTANRFLGKQRIVFYSDQDSLVLSVKPGRTYDFVVLVNGADSAFTQVSTRAGAKPTLTPKLVYTSKRHKGAGADTLAFRLDKKFFIHLQGKVNGSDSLDFLFDTGAGAVVIGSSLLETKVRAALNGSTTNVGTDGSGQVKTSSGNKLEIGDLTWQNASLLAIDYKGFPFDAVLGWVAFENKVVAIDYEKRQLIVSDAPSSEMAEYARVDLKLLNGIPYVKCALAANGRQTEGWFDLDTGSDGGLLIGQQFAASSGLARGLKRIGSAETRGSSGGVVKQRICVLPTFRIGTYELYELPLAINEADPVGGVAAENMGSQVLKRFNWILDFKHNVAYCKPNKWLYAPLPESSAR